MAKNKLTMFLWLLLAVFALVLMPVVKSVWMYVEEYFNPRYPVRGADEVDRKRGR
jgi:hypothetical protein